MNWLLWSIGAALFGAALWAVYRAFSNPVFVAKITAYVTSAAFKALLPDLIKAFRPKSPEEQKLDNEAYRRGETCPTKLRPHPDEKGGSK
jgi:hypothetical protein